MNIDFSLKQMGMVDVDVIDPSGRCIRELFSGMTETGLKTIRLDDTDDSMRPVSAEIYLIRVNSPEGTVRRM